jgi:hypothetical protein
VHVSVHNLGGRLFRMNYSTSEFYMKPKPTRFDELGYMNIDENLWRIVSMEDGAVIGPQYKTKTELLCDLERYATEYGCVGT